MTTRSWALLYGSLGWRVFPVVPGGKRPLYRGWQRDATSDPEQIARYWRTEPAPNIGVVCGEAFDAFDIEQEHLDRLRSWISVHRHLVPTTPISRTGRGGIHILVQPLGIGRGRDLYLAGEHVGELKSLGGFVVVCPSITVGPYTWRSEPTDTLATAPAWLLGLLERPPRPPRRWPTPVHSVAQGRRKLEGLAGAVCAAGAGRRNNLLYWAMRRAIEEGVPVRYAALALLRAALEAGLTESEATATLRSAVNASGTPA